MYYVCIVFTLVLFINVLFSVVGRPTVEINVLYSILLRPYINTPSWQRFIVSHNNAFRSFKICICDVVLVLCLSMLSLTVVLRVLGKVFSV